MTPTAAGQAQLARQVRATIAARLAHGDSLERVERELIAPARLPEEQQAALWLYGWSLPQRAPARNPRLPVWVAFANALATLVGIHRH